MATFLIENTSWSPQDWYKLFEKASHKTSYKLYSEPNLAEKTPLYLAAAGSIGGLKAVLSEGCLQLEPGTLPSDKDQKFLMTVLEEALQRGIAVKGDNGSEVTQLSLKEFFSSSFADRLKQVDLKDLVIQRGDRKADISSLINKDEKSAKIQQLLVDKLNVFSLAPELDVYPVDDIPSVIWDGRQVWVNDSVQQVLFSQKVFKGRVCGEISMEAFKEAVRDKVWDTGYGYLFTHHKKLSSIDLDAISIRMKEHYKPLKSEKKYEQLKIEVGKLKEISYEMSKTIFSSKSLSTVTEKYMQEGVSKGQLEVTALAVSGMLEIAALNRGKSIDEMVTKLIAKHKLTQAAAFSVAEGFIEAAKEEKPHIRPGKNLKWVFLGLIIAALLVYLWQK